MSYLPEKGWKRIAVITFYVFLGLIVICLAGQALTRFLLPFILAWLAAALLHPLTVRLGRHTVLPRRMLRILCMAAMLGLLGFLAVAVCDRLLYESKRLLELLAQDAPDYIESFFGFFSELGDRFPFIASLTQNETREGLVISAVESMISAASAHLPDWIATRIAALPDLLLFTVMTVIASFYMAADFDKINAFLCAQLPTRAVVGLRRFRRRMVVTGFRYLRAYAIMTAITFALLLTGFWMLRIEYAFTLALFTALVDILPVLGIGTVLLPWASVLLLTGNLGTGIGLLALFGIVTLLRRFLEPKILGVSLGLYPLAILIALYAGYRLAGVSGMLLTPVLLIVLKDLNDAGTIPLWRSPERNKEEDAK